MLDFRFKYGVASAVIDAIFPHEYYIFDCHTLYAYAPNSLRPNPPVLRLLEESGHPDPQPYARRTRM